MSRRAWMAALLAAAVVGVACDGAVSSGRATGRGGDPGSPSEDAGAGAPPPAPGTDAGSQGSPPPDAMDCADGPVAAITRTDLGVSDVRSDGMVVAAARAGGGAVVAWSSSGGVRMVDVDASGRVSEPVTVEGNDPWGIAASATHRGLLVDRGSDTLAFVLIDDAGASVVDRALIGPGGGGGAWGPYIRTARLAWTGDRWVAYFALTEGGHYGDRVLYFDPDGAPLDGGWSWGCSHSMDVRIAVHPGGPSMLCISDCYPEKGMLLDASTMLHPDPTGDCSGGTSSSLGGVAVLSDGSVWAGLATSYDRSSTDVGVVRIDAGDPSVRFLTEDGGDDEHMHLGPWGEGLVAGWVAGGRSVLTVLDAQGAILREPEAVPDAAFDRASDLFVHAGRDLGWAQIAGGGVELWRLPACRE